MSHLHHIATSDTEQRETKVFVTLRKKKGMKYLFSVPSPNPNPNCNTKPLDHEQLWQTMHTIPPNVHRANVMHVPYQSMHVRYNATHVQYNISIVTAYMVQKPTSRTT